MFLFNRLHDCFEKSKHTATTATLTIVSPRCWSTVAGAIPYARYERVSTAQWYGMTSSGDTPYWHFNMRALVNCNTSINPCTSRLLLGKNE